MPTYGALPPKKDLRNYKVCAVESSALPSCYNLSEFYSPKVKNQKNTASCVAHAISSVIEYYLYKEHDISDTMSTEWIYGSQRRFNGRTDPGMYMLDAVKILAKYGEVYDSSCTGNNEVTKCFDHVESINEDTVTSFGISSYAACPSQLDMKYAIYNFGPIIASIKWYDSYYLNKIGQLIQNTESDYGYHCLYIYGWSEDGWLAQNSWGESFGNNGKFIIPFSIPIEEAYSLVDAEDKNIDIPKSSNSSFFDILYKIFNVFLNLGQKIINLFKK